jgi:uncharacterized protein YndB with AHSA1/START domain
MSEITAASSHFNLSFSRVVDVPRAKVWQAWTRPEHLMPWFCPRPWQTIECEMDLQAGGLFRTVMQSPDGQTFPNLGCYLQIVDQRKLVWTNALLPGFRPVPPPTPARDGEHVNFTFTAIIELADEGPGTRYQATVLHGDEAGMKKHQALGFEQGWGIALDQMVAMIKGAA